jgi:hypothetical protein
MAATTPKKKFTRKTAKRYDMVSFETEIFDGTFTLPDQRHFTLGIAEALNKGDVGALLEWLEGTVKVDEETVDAIRDLDQTELQDFIKGWGKGSAVDAGKSSD